jgi:hypothetical protein
VALPGARDEHHGAILTFVQYGPEFIHGVGINISMLRRLDIASAWAWVNAVLALAVDDGFTRTEMTPGHASLP